MTEYEIIVKRNDMTEYRIKLEAKDIQESLRRASLKKAWEDKDGNR